MTGIPGGMPDDGRMGTECECRQGIKALVATVFTGGLVASALAVAPAAAGAASTSSAPGVTSNSITVGTISTQTGTLASNFSSLIYGEKAYYQYINAQGGVNGRKIDYKYALDDGGNPTTFNQLANTLINQDHVFAVTGVATAFFSPNLFTESGIPTYGYNVTGNWAGASNLFAAGGSVQYYPAEAPIVGYVSKQTKSPKIAFVAYGVAASADACQAGAVRPDVQRVPRRLHRLQGQLPGHHGGHRRAAHEAGRRQHGRQLHGRAGQHHHGPGRAAVRPQGHPALVQRQRPGDAAAEPEPHAGRLLQHRPRALHGADVDLSRA